MTQIIAFEGLSYFLFGTPTHVQRGLLSKLDEPWVVYNWIWNPKYTFQSADKVIIIGHSFGGHAAIECARRAMGQVDLLVTFDPRRRWTGGGGFVKPSNVKTHVNYWQAGFMRGWEVKHATNIQLNGSHTTLPTYQPALELIKTYL